MGNVLTKDGVRLHYDEYGKGDRVVISAQIGFYPEELTEEADRFLRQTEENGKWYRRLKNDR